MKQLNDHSIFIFSGEHSGDIHGAKLANSLKEMIPNSRISGVAGPYMRAEGIKPFMEMESFTVMGFTDVALALPRILKYFRAIRSEILKSKPDIVILIDYQEFSMRLAKTLRKSGYKGKLVQYISPSVWAWRKNRTETIAKYFDLLLTIYPFESDYYKNTNLSVKYVGNPTKERVDNYNYDNTWKSRLDIPDSFIISLFPGSRKSEIQNNLPLQLKVAKRLREKKVSFAVSSASKESKKYIHEHIRNSTLVMGEDIFIIPREYSYELMRDSKIAIAKSGTVTLELALHNKPTIVTYNISRIHKFICKNLLQINLPFYCIVNIIANMEVFPEFIDAGIDPKDIVSAAKNLLNDTGEYNRVVDLCKKVNNSLLIRNVHGKAARAIQEILLR